VLASAVGADCEKFRGAAPPGGTRPAEDALAMIEAGASRLGLSSSAKILEEL